MSYKKKKTSFKKKESSFALNITSMTDMFTIMLVFLLQTYATGDVGILPEVGIRLPQSNSELHPTQAPVLVVMKNNIHFQKNLNDKTEKPFDTEWSLTLKDGLIQTEDISSNDPNYIPKLFQELTKNPNPKEQGQLILQGDSSLPYATIKKIMYTASMAGFPQLKMATLLGK